MQVRIPTAPKKHDCRISKGMLWGGLCAAISESQLFCAMVMKFSVFFVVEYVYLNFPKRAEFIYKNKEGERG